MGKLTHGSLFSGIGGFDLAAEWAGWENKFHCEWNEFGKRVLNYYWPEVECYGDITKTDFRKWRGQIDVLTGGFPCQPYSVAGKRLGKEDERHLWPHMLRAIREIKPKYVVGENVRGIISWNGGLVFDEVKADLEAEGYTVIPCVLPACGVNAPHRRERVWFVAYRDCIGLQDARSQQQTAGITRSSESGITPNTDSQRHTSRGTSSEVEGFGGGNNGEQETWRQQTQRGNGLLRFQQNVADTANTGIEDLRQSREDEIHGFGITSDPSSLRLCECENTRSMGEGQSEIRREGDKPTNATETSSSFRDAANSSSSGWIQNDIEQQADEFKHARPCWDFFPTQPPICGGDDGFPRELDGITFPKWRSESIKAYGNAIVPAVAFEIFKAKNEIDNFLNKNSYLL